MNYLIEPLLSVLFSFEPDIDFPAVRVNFQNKGKMGDMAKKYVFPPDFYTFQPNHFNFLPQDADDR